MEEPLHGCAPLLPPGGEVEIRAIFGVTEGDGCLAVQLDLLWFGTKNRHQEHERMIVGDVDKTPLHRAGSGGQYRAQRTALDRAAQSFRAITSSERASIQEQVLAVVTARAGETLVQLGRRTGNTWSPQETAVANGVPLDVRFSGGFAVKIAKERPYRSR